MMAKPNGSDESLLLPDENIRYFLNPESVSRHLYCSICQEVFAEPQRAPCGHSYCKVCIETWLKTSRTCPEDRKPLKKTDMHHDFILENIIGDQKVACPFWKLGCSHIGELQLSLSHKKSCVFNPANLPTFMKKDVIKSTKNSDDKGLIDSEEEGDLTPPKPSLKMRLFSAGGAKKDLLCAMFDNKEEEKSRGSPSRKRKRQKDS